MQEDFKLTLEHHNRKFTFEASWETDVNQAIEAFYGLLVSDGYIVPNIKQAFIEFGEELNKQ